MFSSGQRRYPDNEVRVAVFVDPASPFNYGYHDISKGQKPVVLEDIDEELWSQLCDHWPCPSSLQSTRYGCCWFFMFLVHFSASLCSLPYAILITSPLYASLFWSLYIAWTAGIIYSLKVAKRRILEDFGPATKTHIESLAGQLETEAGYSVDYGVDGLIQYARFRKLDRSDFEHGTPVNHGSLIGLGCLLVSVQNLVPVILGTVFLLCPLGVLMISELGTSGLEQRISYSTVVHEGLNWPLVRFSQWSYYNPQYPDAKRIIFSSEQRVALGMEENSSMVLKLVPARMAALAYAWFLFRALHLSFSSRGALERQEKSIWYMGVTAICSCLLIGLALIPIWELLQSSPLCGPYYIELPFVRRYSSNHQETFRYYGTSAIFREDIHADCILSNNVLWQVALGVANLLFLFAWFLRQKRNVRKRQLLAMTEANLSHVHDDNDRQETLEELQEPKLDTVDTLSESTEGEENDPSPRLLV